MEDSIKKLILIGIIVPILWISIGLGLVYFACKHSVWWKFFEIFIPPLLTFLTLLFLIRQILIQRGSTESDILIRLFSIFESDTYRQIRKIFCQRLQEHFFQQQSEQKRIETLEEYYEHYSMDKVLGLFELISLLWQKGSLQIKEINAVFGEYIDAYYELFKPLIEKKNKEGFNFLPEFKKLGEKIQEMTIKEGPKMGYKNDMKSLKEFVEAEARMEF